MSGGIFSSGAECRLVFFRLDSFGVVPEHDGCHDFEIPHGWRIVSSVVIPETESSAAFLVLTIQRS